jgi:hypothetical protein
LRSCILFVASLILVVAAALVFAAFAVAHDLVGRERTRDWIRGLPGRLMRASRGFLKALFVPAPDTRTVYARRPSVTRGSERLQDSASSEVPATARGAGSFRPSPAPLGGREALQLLGIAFVAARAFGWLDLDGIEEMDDEFDLGVAEELGGSELPPNPGDHYVRDGKVVDGYFRTNADATDLNNYSGPFGKLFRRLNGRG